MMKILWRENHIYVKDEHILSISLRDGFYETMSFDLRYFEFGFEDWFDAWIKRRTMN